MREVALSRKSSGGPYRLKTSCFSSRFHQSNPDFGESFMKSRKIPHIFEKILCTQSFQKGLPRRFMGIFPRNGICDTIVNFSLAGWAFPRNILLRPCCNRARARKIRPWARPLNQRNFFDRRSQKWLVCRRLSPSWTFSSFQPSPRPEISLPRPRPVRNRLRKSVA